MLSTLNPTDVLDAVVISIGVILLLKKIADMDRYHWARVVILTLILSWIVILLFVAYGIDNNSYGGCIVEFEPEI